MDGFIGEMMMTEYAPFKVGDYIPKYNVTTREGSAQYRRMAEFCNRMGYVMEEREIEHHEFSEDLSSHEIVGKEAVYMICEPTQPEPPSQREALEAELAECHAWFKKAGGSDELACKCMCEGLVFKDTYPSLYAEGVAKRKRINEIETELGIISTKDKTKPLPKNYYLPALEAINNKEFSTRQEARDFVGSEYTNGNITQEQMNMLVSKIDEVYGDNSYIQF